MIDVGKFAKPALAPGGGLVSGGAPRFGMANSANAATILRHIADEIEAGRLILQKVQSGSLAVIDEWFCEALYLEFVPVLESTSPSGVKELYGPDGEFPIALGRVR